MGTLQLDGVMLHASSMRLLRVCLVLRKEYTSTLHRLENSSLGPNQVNSPRQHVWFEQGWLPQTCMFESLAHWEWHYYVMWPYGCRCGLVGSMSWGGGGFEVSKNLCHSSVFYIPMFVDQEMNCQFSLLMICFAIMDASPLNLESQLTIFSYKFS